LLKRVFVLASLLSLVIGAGVTTRADSLKHRVDKSVGHDDFGDHGKHIGLFDQEKACWELEFDHHSDKLGDNSDKDNGEHKDRGKHKGKDKNKNSCNDNDQNIGNEFTNFDSTDHLGKFSSSNSTPTLSTSTVITPEPASFVLLCVALTSVAFLRRKR
jgi:PEP-CTERM putative exosortase interaction domain